MRKAYFQLHLSILLWGFTGLFGRAIDLNEIILVWYRLFIAFSILLIFALWSKKIKLLSWTETKRISVLGLLVAVHWILFYGSIRYSNISVALSCLSTIAIFTSLLEPLLLGRKINFPELISAFIASVGMYLIFTFQKFYYYGIILGIASALVGSVFTILNSRLNREYNSETITTYQIGSGFFYLTLFLPFYIYFRQPNIIFPDEKNWLLLFILSTACTIIPFNLSIKAFNHLSAYTSNLFNNLEPIYGIFLAFIFFHEQKELTPGFYAGTILIFSSVVVHLLFKNMSFLKRVTR